MKGGGSPRGAGLHLAFATLKYYPFGGLEKSFLNICRETIRRGHRLTIFCSSWEGDLLAGAEIIELPCSGLTNHGRLRSFHRKLMAAYRQADYDLLVGFKRIPDLDLYYNGDVCFLAEAGQKHGRWYRWTSRYRTMARFEASVFSPAAITRIMYIAEREKLIYQRCYGTPDERFHELPAGIDKQAIRRAVGSDARARIREQAGVAEGDTVLLMVGSDFRRKGVDRSIAALASLPREARAGALLWIVGSGDNRSLEKLARQLGVADRLKFWGARSDVPDILAAADVLLHPALTETAGNAIIEGMVAGLPVIVSASAGFSVHVERGAAGILLQDEPYSQADFDHALARLLCEPRLREELGRNAWRYADATDLYRRPQVAVDIIEGLVRERQRQQG